MSPVLDISSPIISEPMAYAALLEMAAAVINAGGPSFLPGGM
jgi:NAD(P)H-dependent flavin oxidoreductase YrpB (nitropropane dioxygenase family)